MTKEVAALDIDDVVVEHVEGFIAWSNQTYGTNLTLDNYSEAWHELWGIRKEDEEERKKLFFVDEVVGSFEVIEGAPEGLIALSAVKKIIGVTSRRESLKPITERVLEEIAPGAVDQVVFATLFKGGQKVTRSKADICREINAQSFTDDQVKHCEAVSSLGIQVVLFGDYPWNRLGNDLPQNISRAKSWSELVDELTSPQDS